MMVIPESCVLMLLAQKTDGSKLFSINLAEVEVKGQW